MNKDTLQNVVVGLLSLVISVLGFMLKNAYTDIEELKHETDLHISEANQRIHQNESELGDLWTKYNDMLERAFDMEMKHMEKQNELDNRITKLEK